MQSTILRSWVLLVSGIVVLAGLAFVFIDPSIYPVDNSIVPRLVQGILGATLMGWGSTMLLVARYAFMNEKPELLRLLLYGFLVWAPVDMVVSVYYQAWFNIALNLAILVLAGVPLYFAGRPRTRNA
jgi:CDP-diglyceride synthetase